MKRCIVPVFLFVTFPFVFYPYAALADNYATVSVQMSGNLDAGSALGTGDPFSIVALSNNIGSDPSITTFDVIKQDAAYSTFLKVYDSLWQEHILNIYFFQSGTANSWEVGIYTNGGEVSGGIPGVPYRLGGMSYRDAPFAGCSGSMDFLGDGTRVAVSNPDITVGSINWVSGANASNISFTFDPYTQFSTPSNISSVITPTHEVPITVAGNLDAGATSGSADPWAGYFGAPPGATNDSISNASEYSFKLNITDGANVQHSLVTYFFKKAANQWDVGVYTDAGEIEGGTAGEPYRLGGLSGGSSLTFQGDGTRTPPIPSPDFSSRTIEWANPSPPSTIEFTFDPFTQLSTPSVISSVIGADPYRKTPSAPSDLRALD